MKILFAIPTLFREDRQEIIEKCINHLKYQCILNNISYKIIIVCNTENKNFNNWKIDSNKILKKISGVRFNIASSLNRAIEEITDDNYFCFIHDDMIIQNNKWIKSFINLYENDEINCGILGIRPHYKGSTYYRLLQRFRNKIFRTINDFYKKIKFFFEPLQLFPYFINKFKLVFPKIFNRLKFLHDFNIEEQSWVDGILFLSTDKLKEIGKFDEDYVGDCESEDFNYRIREHGYRIYRVITPYIHYAYQFILKVKENQNTEFMNYVKKSRFLLLQRWGSKKDIIYP